MDPLQDHLRGTGLRAVLTHSNLVIKRIPANIHHPDGIGVTVGLGMGDGLRVVIPHALNASRMRRCKMMESCRFIGASTCKLLSYTYRVSVHEEQADREDPKGDQDRDSPGGVDAKSNPDQAE